MKIRVIKPGFEVLTPLDQIADYPRQIELAGRTCYKSEDKIDANSAGRFVRMLVKSGHHSVLEHCNITVKIICDRACSHQLVRHRIAAYSQESQRYCDYSKGGNNVLSVVCPPLIGQKIEKGLWQCKNDTEDWKWESETGDGRIAFVRSDETNPLWVWLMTIRSAYQSYEVLRSMKVPPEDARSVLPNATKTEVVTTFNLRQWRHVFEDRARNPRAQWQIREIMIGLLLRFGELLPDVFGDFFGRAGQ